MIHFKKDHLKQELHCYSFGSQITDLGGENLIKNPNENMKAIKKNFVIYEYFNYI